jgi:thiamine kinase-like enzyme
MGKKNKQDLQILEIKKIYPNTQDIKKLDVLGGNVHDIYVVINQNYDKFICRFSSKSTAQHNLYASKLLTSYDINVPQISLHKTRQGYCETYPFIEGKTFYERIKEGLSKEKQLEVYTQMFNVACKISKIPYDYKIQPPVCLTYKIAGTFFNTLNLSDFVLCHTDLHAKNVILDDQDNLFALLDLDSVFKEYMAFALIILIKDMQMNGCDATEIIKLCEEKYIFPKLMGIETQSKIYSKIKDSVKSILGDKMVKQILKIRLR